MLGQLHPGLEGITDVETDPKGRFVSFKITLCNNRVLCVCAPSGHCTRDQLTKGRFFEGLQNNMENKCEGSENKILLGDFNITIGIMDRDGGNKTTRNVQNQAISKMYTDDNKSKHSSNPTDILKSAKKFI